MRAFLFFLISILFFCSCTNNKNQTENKQKVVADSIVVIKKPYENSPDVVEYEVPVLKGTNIRHGIQKRFYRHGSLYSEIPYKNGKREGIAYTYYPVIAGAEPVVWKEQPYINNSLNGICRRFHEDGVLQAEYEYRDGLPATGLKEYSDSGKPVKMPELILSKSRTGSYFCITARLSNNSKNVKYYLGSLVNGKYLHNNLKSLQEVNGKGEVLLPDSKKSATITAVYITRYRNRYIVSKTITL